MESINNLSIEIKKVTSCHNKMEDVLNDHNQAKTLVRVKKVENVNEIMEATDLIEWFYDESSESCRVLDVNCVLNCIKYQNLTSLRQRHYQHSAF